MKTDLRNIPGVGQTIEQDLINIGINSVNDLCGADPEELYIKDALFKGQKSDRCLLYVFRLAVYFAENDIHDEEKLKWWYWKDKEYKPEKSV
ncbi:helix-hairpin-helix domain-containing protein [Lachnospiraceae bacterium NSJ-143]|nr:helix-hairpin-helix domain-containing protein [Lachnospiraceae bacterium NSJ-143]